MKNIIKSTLFFLVVLSGCSKDSLNNDGTRLYKVIHKGVDTAFAYTIEYDMNDKPVRILRSFDNPNIPPEYDDIKYDSAGRVSGYTQWGSSFTFEYDQHDRIIRQYRKWPGQNGPTELDGEYQYDNQGRLISDMHDVTYDSQGRSISGGGRVFQYDNNSNIIEVNYVYFKNAAGEIDSVRRLETVINYNSSPNPWNKIGMVMYFVFNDWLMLSRNIPISSQEYEFSQKKYAKEYIYSYYASGYPKSLITNYIYPNYSFGGDYPIEFEYR